MFLSERGPHGCDSISLRLFPGKVAKIFRRARGICASSGAVGAVPPSYPPSTQMQGNIFSDRDTVEDINQEAGRPRAPPFKRVPVKPRREDVSPNWPFPSPSMQQRRLALVTSMPFRELRSRSWAPFYQHSEVLCSPDPSWCCHVWFNVQQRDHPPSDIERASAGLRVPRHGAVHLRQRGLRSMVNRDSGAAEVLL